MDVIMPNPAPLSRHRAWWRQIPPSLLTDECARRTVVHLLREEATKHGYHGRVRFVTVGPYYLIEVTR